MPVSEGEIAESRVLPGIFGHCRSAVVDSRLKVIGIHDLRVVDAGVMPLITSGNTNSPTLMIAERAASWIIQDGLSEA